MTLVHYQNSLNALPSGRFVSVLPLTYSERSSSAPVRDDIEFLQISNQ